MLQQVTHGVRHGDEDQIEKQVTPLSVSDLFRPGAVPCLDRVGDGVELHEHAQHAQKEEKLWDALRSGQ